MYRLATVFRLTPYALLPQGLSGAPKYHNKQAAGAFAFLRLVSFLILILTFVWMPKWIVCPNVGSVFFLFELRVQHFHLHFVALSSDQFGISHIEVVVEFDDVAA